MQADYIYSDAQAIADGLLVDITALGLRINRHVGVTALGLTVERALVDRCSRGLWDQLVGPRCRDELDAITLRMVDTAVEGETAGHLLESRVGGRTVWAERNERNNWTLMRPEDR